MKSQYNKHMITNHNRNMPTEDNVYIDVKVINDTDQRTVRAQFNQTKTRQIIDNPSNYYLTLARWKVPAFEFPLLIFPVQNGQSNPNLSDYSITLETSTDIFQTFLFYVAYDSSAEVPTTAIPKQAPTNYYFVYDYQQMIDIINTAFTIAFENVTGKPGGSTIPPIMIFNPETRLFGIQAEETFFSVDTNPTPLPPAFPTTQPSFDADIKIYFNFKLYSLFNGLNARFTDPNGPEATDGRDVQIVVKDFGYNNINNQFVLMEQNFPSIAYWSPVQQVIFETTLIPINSEFTTTSPDSFKKVLTDFEPITDSSQDVRTTLQYFPQGVYRLTDLIGTKPLYNIDLTAKWLDLEGNEYFVEIPPFQQFSAKLLFVKRNLYKTDNTLYDS